VATQTPPCRTPSAVPAPQVAMPPVSAAADQGRVDPGAQVNFTETVTGPTILQVDCQQPLQLVVTDATGLSVYSGAEAPVAAGLCGRLSVAAGAAEAYQVSWPVDPSLPGGTYQATLMLGDAPELTLAVAVGAIPGGCG